MGANQSADQRLGSKSTTKQVVEKFGDGQYLKGKVAIVTGGNSGIGLETCKALALAGARVLMCSRSIKSGEYAIKQEIEKKGYGGYTPENIDIVVKSLDLASLQSIKAFADDILANETRLDFLVCNAGIMALPSLEFTEAGFEKQIGVNHFGHFYLTRLLLPLMLRDKDSAGRVVLLTSSAHTFGSVRPTDLHYQHGRAYSGWEAYGQSKQANLLFAKSLADKTKGTHVTAVSVHPGVIQTALWKQSCCNRILGCLVQDKSVPQGAASTVWACVSVTAGSEQMRGAYICDCAPKQPSYTAADNQGVLREQLWVATQEQLDAALKKCGLFDENASKNLIFPAKEST